MSSPYLGQITMFGGNFAPRGWAFCNGQLLAINQNSALFSLIGTIYGGDGRTTFGLPDLRGRVPMHWGNGPGLTNRQIGSKSGAELVTLTASQIPSHNHLAKCVAPAGNSNDAVNNYWADDAGVSSGTYHTGAGATLSNMNAGAIANAGGGGAHNNMQPYLAISFIIALQGVYPSRN